MSILKWRTGLIDRIYDQKSDEEKFNTDPFRSLIKESAQNSLDALKHINETIEKSTLLNFDKKFSVGLNFEIIELNGQAKENWKAAIDYENSFMTLYNSLEEYLKNKKDAIGNRLFEEDYKLLNATKKLMISEDSIFLINITDTNTTGLTGPDVKQRVDEESKHYAFHKTNNQNAGVTGGGSWGLGKNSFSNISSLGMFITCTNIDNPENYGQIKNSKYRIYAGSLQRPVENYNLEGSDIILQSNWNFGEIPNTEDASLEFPKSKNTRSFWNNLDIARNLYIDCLGSQTGTTVQIPVLKSEILGSNMELNLENLISIIEKNCSIWLWPAIESGRLDVRIRSAKIENGYRDESTFEQIKVEPIKNNIVKPYVDTFREVKNSKISETEYKEDLRYFKIINEIYLPKSDEGESTKGTQEYNPNTYLNLHQNIEELNDRNLSKFRNKVALFRNVGIVIRYAEEVKIPRDDICFTAITMLGSSEECSETTILAEKVFRLCENATHNLIANEQPDSKLWRYFRNASHGWGKFRIQRQFEKHMFNNIQKFFYRNQNKINEENEYLKSLFRLANPPVKNEINLVKSQTRKSPDEIEVTLLSPKKSIYEIELIRAIVSEKEDKGTFVKFSEITRDNSPWEDINHRKLSIKKDPQKYKFLMSNESDSDNTFKVVLKLDSLSKSGIDVSSLDFKLDFSIKKINRNEVVDATN